MTTADSHDEDTLPSAWEDESLLYLMGELSPSRATEFEAKLAEQPELAEVLADQAEMISIVADAAVEPVTPSDVTDPELRRRWPVVTALLAVAACLVGLAIGTLPNSKDELASSNPDSANAAPFEGESGVVSSVDATKSDPETLLIARAWAQERATESSVQGMLSDEEPNASLTAFPDAGDEEIDSTLSWMYIAVSNSLEEANDG